MQFIEKWKDTILANGVSQIKVQDYVFAYGSAENFIMAKRHPTELIENWNVDTTKTFYYIIDISKENEGNNMFGLLRELEFEDKLFDLGIYEFEFDKVFPETKH